MELSLTEEQKALQEALNEFAKNEIRPVARDAEEAGDVPERISKQLVEMGVAAPVPEDLGGQGTFDSVTSLLIAEEVAWGDPGIAYSTLGSGLASTLVDLVGTQEQRKDLLPLFLDGASGSLALAERDGGADIFNLEAKAAKSDGGFSLSGTKYAVVHAEDASVRLAVTAGQEGPELWIVPPESEILANPEDKLGLRSAKTYKVILDGARVAAEQRLGGDNADPEKVRLALLRAKLLNAGIALGLARAALEYASDYAKERVAFGRPIGAFQGISFKIADRATDLDGARILTWKAAWAVDQARPDADRLVMAACGQAISAAVLGADDGVQVLGGHGYMKDHPQEMWYRDAMTLATMDNPSLIGDLYLAKRYEVKS